MLCSFSTSDPTVQLQGAIFEDGKVTSSNNVLVSVAVLGNNSTQFDLPAGKYRYEFNIFTGGKFKLTLSVGGTSKKVVPEMFDPNDPILKEAAKVDQIALFELS